MKPYEVIAKDFTEYLNERHRELETRKGMGQIQLYNGDNYEKINRMKEDFCRLRGVNQADVNIRWALNKGITEYCIRYLEFIPGK